MKSYDNCILFLLAKSYQKAHGVFKKQLHSYGLTPIQHLVLEALWDEDGLTVGEIGKRLVFDGATLSGVLDRLSAGGWVLKQSDAEDKRMLRISLTAKSKDLKPKLTAVRNETNKELLARFSLEEKVLLKRLLRDIQAD
jgi:DNA-binding MarR family transcriptional regulator